MKHTVLITELLVPRKFLHFFAARRLNTVDYAIMPVSLTRIDYNAIDKEVNAVRIARTFAYLRWILRDFSYSCQDISLDDGPIFLI